MEAVNLLPLEYRDRKRKRAGAADSLDGRRTLQLGGAVALVFALLLAGLYIHERSVVNGKRKELATDQARIAAVQPQIEAIKNAQAAASSKLAAAQTVVSTRMNWPRTLNDFARVLPTSSYLTALQVAAPVAAASAATPTTTPSTGTPSTDSSSTPAPTATSSGLTIGGVAPNTPGVAQVMDRLSLLPWLSGVTLQSASRQGDSGYSFNLNASVTEAH